MGNIAVANAWGRFVGFPNFGSSGGSGGVFRTVNLAASGPEYTVVSVPLDAATDTSLEVTINGGDGSPARSLTTHLATYTRAQSLNAVEQYNQRGAPWFLPQPAWNPRIVMVGNAAEIRVTPGSNATSFCVELRVRKVRTSQIANLPLPADVAAIQALGFSRYFSGRFGVGLSGGALVALQDAIAGEVLTPTGSVSLTAVDPVWNNQPSLGFSAGSLLSGPAAESTSSWTLICLGKFATACPGYGGLAFAGQGSIYGKLTGNFWGTSAGAEINGEGLAGTNVSAFSIRKSGATYTLTHNGVNTVVVNGNARALLSTAIGDYPGGYQTASLSVACMLYAPLALSDPDFATCSGILGPIYGRTL
jgi:hypothetical protein